jgi:protein SCO1/2
MKNTHLGVLFALVASVLVFLNNNSQKEDSVNQAHLIVDRAPVGGDFTLSASDGPLSLKAFSGKVVLLYFGYTTCPDICPTNLGNLSAAMNKLTNEEQTKVQVLMITVDPERDDQAKLDIYLPYFHKSFKGLTGTPEQIAEVAKRYGAVYQKAAIGEGSLAYAIDHSAFTYLIDQQGSLVAQLPHDTNDETFITVIRSLLKLESLKTQ